MCVYVVCGRCVWGGVMLGGSVGVCVYGVCDVWCVVCVCVYGVYGMCVCVV